jgi:hypothetical protein
VGQINSCSFRVGSASKPDKKDGDCLVFTVSSVERDSLLFALKNVEERAKSLRGRYVAALKGEMAQ